MRSQFLVISMLTAASQLAGFVKLWFIARIFGVGADLDGYNLALVTPTMLSGILAGLLQTGLFPVRAKLHASGVPELRDAFERSVLAAVSVAGLLLTAVLMLSSEHLTKLLTPSASDEVKAAVGFSQTALASLVALNTVGDCLGFLLAMRGRFAIAAGAPIVNAVFSTSLLAVWPEGRLLNLVGGTVLGLVTQVAICLWGLHHSGFRVPGPLLCWHDQRRYWIDMSWLAAAILPGVVFTNFLASLPPVWVTSFGDGAVSAFGYAYRLHTAALQLLVMANSTVLLARFSDLVAREDKHSIRLIVRVATAGSAVIGAIAVLCVWLLGSWSLQMLFSGRFDVNDADRVAQHWLWLTVGLPFGLLGNVFAKLWQAQKQPRRMSLIAGGSLVTAAFAFLISRAWLTEYSVPAALTASAISVVVIGWHFVKVEIFVTRTAQRGS